MDIKEIIILRKLTLGLSVKPILIREVRNNSQGNEYKKNTNIDADNDFARFFSSPKNQFLLHPSINELKFLYIFRDISFIAIEKFNFKLFDFIFSANAKSSTTSLYVSKCPPIKS